TLNWNDLPVEIKYDVVTRLSVQDTATFSKSCREAYILSVPTLYRDVRLSSNKSLQTFLRTVPTTHCRHVRSLSIDMAGASCPTSATTDLSNLLAQCTQVAELDLRVPGLLKPSVIPYFQPLHLLKKLSIKSCLDDDKHPLSERLVVSIAASVPNLTHLILDGICRSAMHAPELVGTSPFVPVVLGDTDVPTHPILGDHLSLPSLLSIPTLLELRIRDSHLGDNHWSTVVPRCKLETLEIGSCCYESPEFNSSCAQRIIDVAGKSVKDLSLSSALSSDVKTRLTLNRLNKLRVTSLLPVEELAETLTALSDSPVEVLSLECHEDDLEEQCLGLSDFLDACDGIEKRPFVSRLRRVSLETVEDVLD
ncbi:hypothetical protein BC835DRAFT_1221149, partial [Cytidiella melzeri]